MAGATHVLVLLLAVVSIGILGAYKLVASHADTTQVNCALGGVYVGNTKYVCDFSLPTPVISNNHKVGTFNQTSTNWILCQQKSSVTYAKRVGVYNSWWGYTVSDEGVRGWVNATYALSGGNSGTGYTGSFGNLGGSNTGGRVPLCSETSSFQSVASTVPTLSSGTSDGALQKAVGYAWLRGVDTGVAAYDTQNGILYTAGQSDSYFGSASVMKLFVATNLLVRGQMSGATATTAYKMITQSDDAALEQLLPLVGGTSVVTWEAQHYNIPNLGVPPLASHPSCWGNTRITASGLAQFLDKVKQDNTVAPWLLDAMRHYTPIASDGTNQTFGIPSQAPDAAVKQGWGSQCSSMTNGTVVNTTGIVQNRYVVVILTNTNNWTLDSNGYNATQGSIVSGMAAKILPAGVVSLP